MSSAAIKHTRQLSRRAERLMKRQAPTVLAAAPVKPEAHYPVIEFDEMERAAATIHVWVEPLIVEEPAGTWPADKRAHRAFTDPTVVGEHGNAGNDRAALRAQLRGNPTTERNVANPLPDSGEVVRVAVLLSADGGLTTRKLIVEGTMAAIRRTLPDQARLKSWADAGVTDFPVLVDPQEGMLRTVRWVPLADVPVVLQMEYESRGEAKARAKALARAMVNASDVRADLAAANYQGRLL